jgi:iron-sulfur cluster assembly protein
MSEIIQIQREPKFPVSVTQEALRQILIAREGDPDLTEDHNVRVSCKGGGCSGILFNLDFDNEFEEDELLKSFSYNDETIKVVVDPMSAPYLEGVAINYIQTGLTGGFQFEGGDKVKRTCGCGKSFSV